MINIGRRYKASHLMQFYIQKNYTAEVFIVSKHVISGIEKNRTLMEELEFCPEMIPRIKVWKFTLVYH